VVEGEAGNALAAPTKTSSEIRISKLCLNLTILAAFFGLLAVLVSSRTGVCPSLFLISLSFATMVLTLKTSAAEYYASFLCSLYSRGVVLKDVRALEAAGRVDCVVSELANVLTYGKEKVYRAWENGKYMRTLSEFTTTMAGLAVPEFAYTNLDQAISEYVERKLPMV
jgi:hypothetical protein